MKKVMHKGQGCWMCEHHPEIEVPAVKWFENHHVFGGTANRKISEKYGIMVVLCNWHHNDPPNGKAGVHQVKEIRALLQDAGQRWFEKEYPDIDFYGVFKKYYKIER